jgi:uncharacterized membrane protein YgaE (UPF0421/DUF939 family)
MQNSKHQYAWLLVVVTSGVVGWPSAMNPTGVFLGSVDRVTAVTVGVILSTIAHAVFWPLTAAAKFERAMRELIECCRDLTQVVRRGLLEQSMDMAATEQLKTRIVSLSSSLDSTLHTARVDSRRIRDHMDGYQRVADRLLDLSFATAAVSDAGILYCREQAAATTSYSPSLRGAFDNVDRECVATLEQLSLPRGGTRRPIAVEDVGQTDQVLDMSDAEVAEAHAAGSARLLADRIKSLRAIAGLFRSSLAESEAASSDASRKSPVAASGAALRPRFAKSALASLQIVLAAWFFILLDWPLGLQSAMIAVMALAYMNAQLPVALLARTILSSVASALPLAAVFYFVVMPGTSTFAQLAPWLAVFFLPYLYFIASSNPMTSLAAVVSVIIAKSLISVSTTPPSYDFAKFVNTYLGLSGGFSLVLLLAYFFEIRSPRRGFHKILAVVLAQFAEYLDALGNCACGTSEADSLVKKHRHQSLQSLGKLRKLAALVDYRQDPQIARDQITGVLQAIEILALRLAWACPWSHRSAGHTDGGERGVQQAHDWCAESLAATGQALATQQPITVHQRPAGTSVDLQSATVVTAPHAHSGDASADAEIDPAPLTAYYRSLVDSILDCQHRLEPVDWKRWCWNRF